MSRTHDDAIASSAPAALAFRDFGFSYATPEGALGGAREGDLDSASENALAGAPGGAQKPVLSRICWELPEGAFALVTGSTGRGKTTLLRCAKPELRPAGAVQGSVLAFGKPVEQLSLLESAQTIGYVAQNPETQVVCDTVWHEMAFGLENIGMPQDQMRRRIAETAHFFGIEPWFRAETAHLSGGQKQLLNLAAVLALRPRILLLDEPTGQLDPVAEKDFLHALFRVNRELGLTVLVVTHAPEAMAEYATMSVRLTEDGLQPQPLANAEPLPACGQAARAASLQAERAAAENPALRLDDAYARYARNLPFVLRGTALNVGAGTVHAVVGGNGCGKSTLLNALAGGVRLERGRLTGTTKVRQGYVPQNPKMLFVCDSVAEELREWQETAGYSAADVQDMMAQLGLKGLDGRHPYDLSGGQQQLLALAKVLLCKPAVLLLDEPTKGLDAESKLRVAYALRQQADAGAAVVFATHDLSFAYCAAHTVSMLFDGEIAVTQPTQDFFDGNLFYKPYGDAFTRLWFAADGAADGTAAEGAAADGAADGTAAEGAAAEGAGTTPAPVLAPAPASIPVAADNARR